MNDTLNSMARIFAAPWQERRNRKTMWSVWLILLLLAALAAMLFVLKASARISSIAVVMGLAAIWSLQVASVLEQNHPTLARLTPGHVRRLRGFLLLVWCLLVGMAAAAGAWVHADPWACVAISGASLAALALAIRRPALFVLGYVLALAVSGQRRLVDTALADVAHAWRHDEALPATMVLAASAILLASIVRSGGARHAAYYERRKSLRARMAKRAMGEETAAGAGFGCWVSRVAARPYGWRLHRLTAQPGSSVRARALLALGPALHWTTRVVWLATALGVIVIGSAAVALSPITETLSMTLPSAGVGIMFALMAPLLQLRGRLHQTRREQALLALLPGLPLGAAQSRWLSGQLTWQFLGVWASSLALMSLCTSLVDAIVPGASFATFGDGRMMLGVASLPLLALAWLPWARLPAPSRFGAVLPTLAALGLAAIAFFGARSGWFTPLQAGFVFAALAAAWCALRWRRMGSEPSAFPVGRLAR